MRKNNVKDTRTERDVLYKVTDYPDASFMGGKLFVFIVKKTENFVRAIYLVTNFLSDSEPLKWRLRTISTELIERTMSFMRDKEIGAHESAYRSSFAGCLSALVSLINVGEESGALSVANAELLKREIQTFFPLFNERIFTLRSPVPTLPIAKDFRMELLKRPTRGRPRLSASRNGGMSVINNVPGKNNLLGTQRNLHGHKKNIQNGKAISSEKPRKSRTIEQQERQRSIINIIKDKKKMTSKELMSFMTECSEKSIQRDLSALVADGVLKKVGEKRWSTYIFVQPPLEM